MQDSYAQTVALRIGFAGAILTPDPTPSLDATLGKVNRPRMNVDLIRRRLTKGFRPFALITSSGDRYPVPHPEFVLLTRRTVVVADDDGLTTNLDPLHVVAIEDLPPRDRKGNGRSGGRCRP